MFKISPMTPMTVITASSASERMAFLQSMIRKPSPDWAPIISPDTRKIHAVPMVACRLAMIWGKAAGQTIFVIFCQPFMPKLSATCQ